MDEKKARLVEIVGEGGGLAKPKNVDEVQRIVLWANETQTPLIPVSSGDPHFRGGTSPAVPEAVLVDLSGMKRILRIDRRNRLALIEPGVTYAELHPALKAEGLRMIAPLLPRKNKSVIASLLEREPVMSPRYQWNLLEPLRSLEIIWGNGDKFYSGSGILRGEKDEDWQAGMAPVIGPGPGQLDFYKFISAAQGSMGIVTWASVKCEVYPETHKLYIVPAKKLEDLIDFCYQLLKFRFGDELFIINNTCLAMILRGQTAEIKSLRSKLPTWILVVGISGGQILAEEKLVAQEADIGDIAQQHGLRMLPDLQAVQGEEIREVLQGTSPEPYWKLRSKGGAQEIFFLTTLNKTPDFVATMDSLQNEDQVLLPEPGIYIQPVHQGVGCHCEFILPFEQANQAETHQTQELFRKASHTFFEQGAYFSRPYGIWADMVYEADAPAAAVTQKVKGIFDPRHVMNPGKLCF